MKNLSALSKLFQISFLVLILSVCTYFGGVKYAVWGIIVSSYIIVAVVLPCSILTMSKDV